MSPETTEPTPPSDEISMQTPPSLPTPGPGVSKGGPRKRGHAHRRSGAIASVDLSAISKGFEAKPALDSAPSTPTATKREHVYNDAAVRPMSYSATSLSRPTPPSSPPMPPTGDLSEHTEPVPDNSNLSAERPSTMPPLTPEAMPSTQTEDTARSSVPVVNDTELPAIPKPRMRPKTADAYLAFEQNDAGVPDGVTRRQRPISSAGHSRAHKSLSSGVLDLALRKMKHTSDDFNTGSRRYSDGEYSDMSADDCHDTPESSPTAVQKEKSKRRQKKVRSWAGSILMRSKGKLHPSSKDTSADESSKPPPIITRTNSDLGSGLDVDFDDDNIVVIRTPTNPDALQSSESAESPTTPTLENSWKPRSFYEQGKQQDTQSPIIDLDAALGPFNTPEMRPGPVGSSFSAATKRMYSGGRRGEFVGPEMRYHRRTESAPEMPPFDRGSILGSRSANNLTADDADVFYEEEEDAFLAATEQSPEHDDRPPVQPTDTNDNGSVDSKASSNTLTRHTMGYSKDPGSGGLGIRRDTTDSTQEDREAPETPNAVDQLQQARNPFNQPNRPVDTVKQDMWHHNPPAPSSPDISPGFLPLDRRPGTSPLELGSNIPQLSLEEGPSLSSSSFPSPDFTGTSSEAPRSITTPSTGDRKLSGRSFNIPVEHSHASIEDVPSLTSSASTMTTRMQRLSASFLPHTRLSNDRSASFSAGGVRRTSQGNSAKRSSFASLSKLVAGPGERSKLSYEEKPPGDASEKARKKGRRISRLMHFWRTKDKDRSSENGAG